MHAQNIGQQSNIDHAEYVADINGARALISPRALMSLERLRSIDVDRYFQLPRQLYEFLVWARKNGEESNKFKVVETLPDCAKCERVGPFICLTDDGRTPLCVEHAQEYKPIECLFMEDSYL